MTQIIEKDLCYKITGLCFKLQKKLGRFCRKLQYADEYEPLLKEAKLAYERECLIKKLNPDSPKGNRIDFIVEKRVAVEF